MRNTTQEGKKRVSPGAVAVIAFLITVGLGILIVAAFVLIGPPVPAGSGEIGVPVAPEAVAGVAGGMADVIRVVSNGTCPVAIVVAVLAYVLTKQRQ